MELKCLFLSLLLTHAGVLSIVVLLSLQNLLLLVQLLKEFGPRQFPPDKVDQQQNN